MRYVILVLGVISASYATWDIYLDGVKNSSESGSDAFEMAKAFNKDKLAHASGSTYGTRVKLIKR